MFLHQATICRAAVQRSLGRRCLHASGARSAISNLQMPAMSPTMTEGGIASWKKKEGEAFSVGDVLLEIETDKATIDVEAQEDGILGKILAQDGAKGVPVGKVIAILAEEGDDISNLQAPSDEPAPPKQEASPPPPPTSQPQPPPSQPKSEPAPSHPTLHPEHSRPLFPSVLRLLQENNIPNADKIPGTGVRGMLTKGDVLTYLGQASGPLGTFKEAEKKPEKVEKKEEVKPLDGAAIRRLIVGNFLQTSLKARAAAAPSITADFDSIISDYIPQSSSASPKTTEPKPKSQSSFLDGII
ncbi:hypothetical protein JAAARDRAFT_33204 [Jaapia argillacea MUCL 33604]|uniref:Single hybrid motif-containing protein n=1 Tax=Jaapia argillacea MUCL 33604 TaxID=933084 RepID=A0A067Q802_9AGAM|nr:hypothetical protein JAAARDRAFT_33204 [Jaapia argillacea MUCL 33604]